MDENKSTVLPAKHVVEIRFGKFKMTLYNPTPVTLSVSIREATKEDQ